MRKFSGLRKAGGVGTKLGISGGATWSPRELLARLLVHVERLEKGKEGIKCFAGSRKGVLK